MPAGALAGVDEEGGANGSVRKHRPVQRHPAQGPVRRRGFLHQPRRCAQPGKIGGHLYRAPDRGPAAIGLGDGEVDSLAQEPLQRALDAVALDHRRHVSVLAPGPAQQGPVGAPSMAVHALAHQGEKVCCPALESAPEDRPGRLDGQRVPNIEDARAGKNVAPRASDTPPLISP